MAGWFTLALFLTVSVAVASSMHCHCYNSDHPQTSGNGGNPTKPGMGGNSGGKPTGGSNGGHPTKPGMGGNNGGKPDPATGGGKPNRPQTLPSILNNDTISSLVGPDGVITQIVDGIGTLS